MTFLYLLLMSQKDNIYRIIELLGWFKKKIQLNKYIMITILLFNLS
jgi:hypothetical protein